MTRIKRSVDSHPSEENTGPLEGRGTVTLSFLVGVVVLGAAVVLAYSPTLSHLLHRWSTEPDYSHGFIVPLISAWFLWNRRGMLATISHPIQGRWLGLLLLIGSGALHFLASIYELYLLDALAFIVCVGGTAVFVGGYAVLRWAWPAIAFLIFMIPLPGALATRMSGPLQHLATISSAYTLQTLGIPAISMGNVIWLSHGKIGVVEACSGLRMLMMFAAVTTAAVVSLKLANWERLCLVLSAPLIAIVANVFRIVLTGVAYEFWGANTAEKIFHDLAGWIMMPLAMLLLGLEIRVLSKLFTVVPDRPPVVAGHFVRATTQLKAR